MLKLKKNFRAFKGLIGLAVFGHIAYLAAGIFFGYLGANPVEALTHSTGEWGLYFLLMTLAITPLRRHFHWGQLIHLRRFFGLCSFLYVSLHFIIFILFDHFFFWSSMVEDVIQHPYIAVGMFAFALMIPLAITSFKYCQKKLGKRWLSLHRSVYLVAILAIIHYWWLVKADILWPLVYGAVTAFLLADRSYWWFKKASSKTV